MVCSMLPVTSMRDRMRRKNPARDRRHVRANKPETQSIAYQTVAAYEQPRSSADCTSAPLRVDRFAYQRNNRKRFDPLLFKTERLAVTQKRRGPE
eukprot:5416883-Pyramimonas_sp.AAC.2